MFDASHVAGREELSLIQTGLGAALFRGAFAGILYLAVEPLVRRDWPELLVSLTRLLQGRVRDPRVGRDLLIATLVGIVGHYISWVLPGHFDVALVIISPFQALSDTPSLVSELIGRLIQMAIGGL